MYSWDKISSGVFFLFLASTSVPPSLPSLPLLKFVNKFQKKISGNFLSIFRSNKIGPFPIHKIAFIEYLCLGRSLVRGSIKPKLLYPLFCAERMTSFQSDLIAFFIVGVTTQLVILQPHIPWMGQDEGGGVLFAIALFLFSKRLLLCLR